MASSGLTWSVNGAAGGGFQALLDSGTFAVTAEVGPPRGAETGSIQRKVERLRGRVAAVNITDNAGAHARLSSLAGSLAAAAAGVEPIMQITCRDRNRIALQSELLAASALGLRNVLVMTGDHPRAGDHPDATPVFDLDSVQLLAAARAMRDDRQLMSGRPLNPPPDLFLGAAENPPAQPGDHLEGRLAAKVAAGAQFVQTQFIFDVPAFARWMSSVRDLGLHERCAILAGVGPVLSRAALRHLEGGGLPGVQIPDAVTRRLRGVPPDRLADEGAALCAETIAELRQVPGVAGVHVMAPGHEGRIPAILDQAGLQAVPAPGAGRAH
jgi:methylenetetrahydrofolate reductase (NADPH)